MYNLEYIFVIGLISISKCYYTRAQHLRIFDSCLVHNHIGVCLPVQSCPQLYERITYGYRPRICSYIGYEPIICCVSYQASHAHNFSRNLDRSNLAVTERRYTERPYTTTPPYTMQSTTSSYTSYGRKRTSARMCEKYNEELCPNSVPFILGGDPARGKELPFMAMVGYGSGPEIKWQCGGSLISPQYVLSAGHCSVNVKPRWIRLGDLDYTTKLDDAKPQQFRIAEIHTPPEYNPSMKYNDIALYRLDKQAVLSEYVYPVCLSQSPTYQAGEKVIAAGWGDTTFYRFSGGPGSPKLLKVDMEVFNTRGCNRAEYNSVLQYGLNESSMLCAGSLDGGKDACKGDSGGPLFLQPSESQLQSSCFLYTQIGITSFGYGCGRKDYPSIFTNINYFLPWIEAIVWP